MMIILMVTIINTILLLLLFLLIICKKAFQGIFDSQQGCDAEALEDLARVVNVAHQDFFLFLV